MYRETLAGWHHLGRRGAIANQLECFAFIALARGDSSRAARLLGAAEAIREVGTAPMLPHERAEYDSAVQRLRRDCDRAAVDSAWGEGRRLSVDQAVALALSGPAETLQTADDGSASAGPTTEPVESRR